jgi:hypothetical protein
MSPVTEGGGACLNKKIIQTEACPAMAGLNFKCLILN